LAGDFEINEQEDVILKPADGGRGDFLVFFFHSFGSSGANVMHHQGDQLRELFPNATIRIPTAPVRHFNGNPVYSWFDVEQELRLFSAFENQQGQATLTMLRSMGASDDDLGRVYRSMSSGEMEDALKVVAGIASAATVPKAIAAAEDVNGYIDRAKWRSGMHNRKVILAGFSQGATTALAAAWNRDGAHADAGPLAGVFCISGAASDLLLAQSRAPRRDIPLFIAAGGKEHSHFSGVPHVERVVPVLRDSGFDVQQHIIPDVPHAYAVTKGALEHLRDFAHAHIPGAAPAMPRRRRWERSATGMAAQQAALAMG
jgi:predicted esterase